MLDDLRELYQEVILDHSRNPRNFRHPGNANCEAHGHNPMCGDMLTIYLSLDEDGIIQDAAFEGKGCAIAVASASMMTQILVGKTVAQAERLFSSFHDMCTKDDYDPFEIDDPDGADEDAMERLQMLSGVRQFPIRVKCATLAWHTMKAAVAGDGECPLVPVSTE
jgi:nitrogen fixation NifU-like protein